MASEKASNMKPISLYPLTLKQALSAFMAVDPKKVERRMAREKAERHKNK